MSEGQSVLDRALDEIVADKQNQRNRRRGGGGGNRTPRDGVSKQSRPPRDPARSNWVHDKFDDGNSYRPRENRDTRDNRDNGAPRDGARSSKVRVENLHYDLSEEDLRGVFSRVGDIRRIDIVYDKAGRSEGIAHVLYSNPDEATLAVDQFDGANAKGQPIRVKIASQQGGRRGGGGVGSSEGRSLFDRVAAGPRDEEDLDMDGSGRRGDRRQQQARRDVGEMRQNARDLGIDRYIPGDRNRQNDRRPHRGGMGGERERRRDGGDRRDGRGGRGGGGGRGERTGGSNRPRKTAEELDAEMNDYWTTGNSGEGGIQSSFAPGAEGAFANQAPAQQQQDTFMDPNAPRVTAADVADDL